MTTQHNTTGSDGQMSDLVPRSRLHAMEKELAALTEKLSSVQSTAVAEITRLEAALAGNRPSPAAEAVGVPKHVVNPLCNALNDAAWAMIEALEPESLTGRGWNNLKPALRVAIQHYLDNQPSSQPIEARETVAGAQGDASSFYAITLQRAIEHHCKGLTVPSHIAAECPHHARMLDAALASAQPIEKQPTDIDVRDALTRLQKRIAGLATHKHKMEGTGQTHSFLVKDDVLGWIDEALKSSPPATEAVRKGFWDVYEPGNNKRVYVTVFNSLEAESYRENGYRVVEQSSATEAGEQQ